MQSFLGPQVVDACIKTPSPRQARAWGKKADGRSDFFWLIAGRILIFWRLCRGRFWFGRRLRFGRIRIGTLAAMHYRCRGRARSWWFRVGGVVIMCTGDRGRVVLGSYRRRIARRFVDHFVGLRWSAGHGLRSATRGAYLPVGRGHRRVNWPYLAQRLYPGRSDGLGRGSSRACLLCNGRVYPGSI
jgi:hypothetical protein